MAARTGIFWAQGQSPVDLTRSIERYGDRVMVAIRALADYIAQLLQNEMRQNAPWTDRTGNARSGLFSIAEQTSQTLVTIYLSHGHTVDYGVFLELANGQRFAIIAPTIQRNLPMIERMLRDLLR